MAWNPFETVNLDALAEKPNKKLQEKRRKAQEKRLERMSEYYNKAINKVGNKDEAEAPTLRRAASTSLNSRFSDSAKSNNSSQSSNRLKKF